MAKYVGFRQGKMHESHVISEYYCGRCGWPVTDHDNFCPECGGAFREYDASNLENENAKLRKYAELYARAVKIICDLCPYCDDFETCGDAEVEPMSEECALYMEMRELGIEV